MVWQTSGKGDKILQCLHIWDRHPFLCLKKLVLPPDLSQSLFHHESVHIQDAKTGSEMYGTLLIRKRRKEKVKSLKQVS